MNHWLDVIGFIAGYAWFWLVDVLLERRRSKQLKRENADLRAQLIEERKKRRALQYEWRDV